MTITEKEEYYQKPGNGLMAELEFFGEMTMADLQFVVDSIREYKFNKTTLTREGHVRLWNIREEVLEDFLTAAKKQGISCRGAYRRTKIRVYAPALAGMQEGESFSVEPYVKRARTFLEAYQDTIKVTHGVFNVYFAGREADLEQEKKGDFVFLAQEDHTFKVLVRDEQGELFTLAEKTEAGRFLSYLQVAVALYNTGLTRETYKGAFWKQMNGLTDAQREPVEVEQAEIHKTGNGNFTCGPRVIKQKQEELYAVECHHFGGVVPLAFWKKLAKALENYEDIELRLDRKGTLYVCNLLAEEVHNPLDAMTDAAFTRAEKSRVSDHCSLCARGTLEPQAFVSVLLKEMRKLHFYDGVLPTFTVSGCERCCGRVPREDIIFVNQTEAPADRPSGRYCKVVLTVPRQQELGIMPQQNIAEYLMAIAALVQSAESNFADWYEKNPELMIKLTTLYCQDKVEEEA